MKAAADVPLWSLTESSQYSWQPPVYINIEGVASMSKLDVNGSANSAPSPSCTDNAAAALLRFALDIPGTIMRLIPLSSKLLPNMPARDL